MAPGRRLLPLRVHSVVEVGARMREIRLRGTALATLRFSPSSHVVVRTPERRVYSVWVHRPDLQVIALRVAVHDAGSPGCRWAAAVTAGTEVVIEPPRTRMTVDDAAVCHVFAGDETGSVPLLAMRAAIHRSGSRAPVLGVLEARDAADEVGGHANVPPLPWVHRGSASPVASRVLLDAVRALELPARPGVAYVAGESETCRLVQAHLVEERGWPRRSVKMQPQWAPGHPASARDETEERTMDVDALARDLPDVTTDQPFTPGVDVYRVAMKIFAIRQPETESEPGRVTLKCDPLRALELREEFGGITPGYHMNKKHWITVVLDGSVPPDVVEELVAHAWDQVVAGLPRARQERLLMLRRAY